MILALKLLFIAFGAHALADFPLQGDFLSKGKNPVNGIADVPWWVCMAAHALIHGLFVTLVFGKLSLGVAEFVIHFVIDYVKCYGKLTFVSDQVLHLVCKMVWWVLVIRFGVVLV